MCNSLAEKVMVKSLIKIVDYTTVIYRRIKFIRRLDNRRVIQHRGRYHDGSHNRRGISILHDSSHHY